MGGEGEDESLPLSPRKAEQEASKYAFKYLLVFHDYFSGKVAVAYLKTKESQAIAAAFRQFQVDHQKLLRDGKVWEWHTDADGGFTSKSIDEMC